MIESSLSQSLEGNAGWLALEARLKPFIARRIRSSADADDVLQDVLIRIHKGIGTLRDEQRFGPWVYRIARSAVVDHLRASARNPLPVGVVAEQAAPEPSDDDPAEAESLIAEYAAAVVSMLPEPYREAVRMTDLGGLTQREAAAAAGVSLSGMKSRVQRGRGKIRDEIERCCRIALDSRNSVMECEPRSGDDDCCDRAQTLAR